MGTRGIASKMNPRNWGKLKFIFKRNADSGGKRCHHIWEGASCRVSLIAACFHSSRLWKWELRILRHYHLSQSYTSEQPWRWGKTPHHWGSEYWMGTLSLSCFLVNRLGCGGSAIYFYLRGCFSLIWQFSALPETAYNSSQTSGATLTEQE